MKYVIPLTATFVALVLTGPIGALAVLVVWAVLKTNSSRTN